jgi:hypothetical protein
MVDIDPDDLEDRSSSIANGEDRTPAGDDPRGPTRVVLFDLALLVAGFAGGFCGYVLMSAFFD